MQIKDLTSAQLIEIAKLAYGHPEWITSDFSVRYQPYVAEHYEDAREYQQVLFEGYFIGNSTRIYRVEITPTLDVVLWYTENGLHTMHVNNQREIQKKFTEYGFN